MLGSTCHNARAGEQFCSLHAEEGVRVCVRAGECGGESARHACEHAHTGLGLVRHTTLYDCAITGVCWGRGAGHQENERLFAKNAFHAKNAFKLCTGEKEKRNASRLAGREMPGRLTHTVS